MLTSQTSRPLALADLPTDTSTLRAALDEHGLAIEDLVEDSGTFRLGWTPDDLERVLPRWSSALGTPIVCLWAYHDGDGFDGDSDLHLVVARTRLDLDTVRVTIADLPWHLWDFLNGDLECAGVDTTNATHVARLVQGMRTETITGVRTLDLPASVAFGVNLAHADDED